MKPYPRYYTLEEWRDYQRRWRLANPDKARRYSRNWVARHPGERAATNRRRNKIAKEALRSLKEGRPCTDCGGTYPPWVMDFDHRPGTIKCAVVSDLSGSPRLAAEAAKCDLVCANCHRERTYRRRHQGA